ncbi:MAG: glycosyltransferase family 4 protein [Bacteroidota bacterium]
MKIVYLCHSFYPEISAPASRVLEMSTEWVKSGNEVTVVTCFPNHPTGIIPEKYRGRFFMKEMHQGIRVFRNYVYAVPNRGVFKRILSHLSFTFSAVVFSLPRLGKADVIIASSPTFFPVFAALVISRVKRIPFVFEVRDLWPAAIVELKAIKSQFIIKMLESLELFLYRRAQTIIVVTRSFKENLIERGIPESKIEIVYNGVIPERFGLIQQEIAKCKYSLEGCFIVLYAGTMGLSHALKDLLLVAERLQSFSEIRFLLVGEGAMKERLQELANNKNLENVIFWQGQPREQMPEIYALADICIISMKKLEIFTKSIPSKIFEIMASKRPIIAALEGEAAQILGKSGNAMIIPPENPDSLEKAILTLKNDPALRCQMGENGRKHVEKHFNRSVLAKEYELILKSIVNVKTAPDQYQQRIDPSIQLRK